jgi:hypothetical protein
MSLIQTVLFIGFIALLNSTPARAQGMATVPLDESRFPSDDLVHQGRTLRSDEAYLLKLQGMDLATLDPYESAVWSSSKKENFDQIDIFEGDELTFKGALLSASGLFRFNAIKEDLTAIVHIDKTLHTMLLRKNLLRALGYKVPAMKWIPKLRVKFASAGELKNFLESQIPRATMGAESRWVIEKNEHTHTITMQDVAVTVPSMEDHYNLSQGTPPQNITNRTLRSLIIPYALLDLGESVNKLDWTVGRISDNQVLLPHFTRSSFSTTKEDARWMLQRLAKMTRAELQKIIEDAHFPKEVADLLIEKMSARRNALMKVFGVQTSELAFNPDHEKLTQLDWPGYGSRFAHGDPESPFKDFHWYAIAKLQSIAFDNLLGRINKELSFFDPNAERYKFAIGQFQKGLQHFVKTGEFLTFPVDVWASPVADIGLNASRDVVIGNYMGTDNLVQIADSIGWSVRLGSHIGVENVPLVPTIAVLGTATWTKNWSHLKPLKNLKQALQEPYKNMVVPLLKWQISKDLARIKELQESTNPDDLDIKKEDSKLAEVMTHLSQNLGIGESLIYSENIGPSAGVHAQAKNFLGTPFNAKGSVNSTSTLIRRIQIYRKDAKTIQVYDDTGHGTGWTVDFSLEKLIPVIRIGWRGQSGDYSLRLHEVNLDSDKQTNPKFFDSAFALSEFMQTGSAELLEGIQKPNILKAKFSDRSSKIALLFWRQKILKTHTFFEAEERTGLTGQYVSFTDEKQTGWNWEAFTKDFINLGLKELISGFEWQNNAFQNPAETLYGMGITRSSRFEASLDEEGQYDERYMRVSDRWEGWTASVMKVQTKMREANEKFGIELFDENSIENATALKLYNVSVNLNLYEKGIQRLASIPEDSLIKMENRLELEKTCAPDDIKMRRLSSGQVVESCGSLSTLIYLSRSCQKQDKQEKIDRCLTNLLRKLYEKLTFSDITKLLGRDNIFVNGSVTGFRQGDEILNDPISSNTSGRIDGNFWNGPFETIQRRLGIQAGEFNGYWLRERL